MQITVNQRNANDQKYDWLVVPVREDAREERLAWIAGWLSMTPKALAAAFSGRANSENTFFSTAGDCPGKQLVLVGIGKKLSSKATRSAFRKFFFDNRERLQGNIGVDFRSFFSASGKKAAQTESAIHGALEGLQLAGYQPGKYKTSAGNNGELKIETVDCLVPAESENLGQKVVKSVRYISEAQLLAMELVDMPGNKLTAAELAKRAWASGSDYGFEVAVFAKTEIENKGLHALLAVNRGSTRPPAFIIMDYQPKKTRRKKLPVVGLVGKGVTFDTGGISLKQPTNLRFLKSDMGGAAAVLGAVEAAARLQLPVRVIGIIPATDNMPDGNAVNPGDVIDTYSGLTVEVEDTDAEGRLILADGLAYLKKNFPVDVIIDLATLTGASVIALGKVGGALFSNDDKLAGDLSAAGSAVDERVWRLPLWEEYGAQIESDVADVKNYGGPPAGAITAAKFLEKFIDKHPRWAHLDIAGVVLAQTPFAKERSASGFGVRLLVEYLQRLSGTKK